MEPAIPVMAVIGAIAASVIVVRFATAFAKRLERRPPTVSPTDPAIGELRDALDAMQERLDFLERALVAQRNQSGRALPAAGERAGPQGGTPGWLCCCLTSARSGRAVIALREAVRCARAGADCR